MRVNTKTLRKLLGDNADSVQQTKDHRVVVRKNFYVQNPTLTSADYTKIVQDALLQHGITSELLNHGELKWGFSGSSVKARSHWFVVLDNVCFIKTNPALKWGF